MVAPPSRAPPFCSAPAARGGSLFILLSVLLSINRLRCQTACSSPGQASPWLRCRGGTLRRSERQKRFGLRVRLPCCPGRRLRGRLPLFAVWVPFASVSRLVAARALHGTPTPAPLTATPAPAFAHRVPPLILIAGLHPPVKGKVNAYAPLTGERKPAGGLEEGAHGEVYTACTVTACAVEAAREHKGITPPPPPLEGRSEAHREEGVNPCQGVFISCLATLSPPPCPPRNYSKRDILCSSATGIRLAAVW